MEAVLNNRAEILRILINQIELENELLGKMISCKSDRSGRTLLRAAVGIRNVEIIEMLAG